MAVDESKSPWTYTASADTDGQTGPIKISSMVFRNESGAAADLEVLDASGGNVVARFEAVADGDAKTVLFPEAQWVDGIYVDTMPTSSTLYVYPASINPAWFVPGMK